MGTALIADASAGIGARYACRLAERGYDIILVARHRAPLYEMASQLTTRTGRSFEVVEADLGTLDGLATVETVLRTDSSITLLVNNVSIDYSTLAPVIDSIALERLIGLNITAVARLTCALVPKLVARQGGTIIQVTDNVSDSPFLLGSVYEGIKAFVLAYSQSLRKGLVGQGVRIQTVMPASGSAGTDIESTAYSGISTCNCSNADAFVKAALAGLDRNEFMTTPGVEDSDWVISMGADGLYRFLRRSIYP
ncbi:SDR family NAD(P)-dependent oxidoreductase [Pseudomonas abietaniphila]|uniref:SDR family NAD(P)-dependent oxidoreductase n=1 Tax=Pseudomonas abietaniphila TaxID=89065 RepID=UPI003216D0FE